MERRRFLRSAGAAGLVGTIGGTAIGPASGVTYGLGVAVHTDTSLNVRDDPGTDATIIDTKPEGMRGTVQAGPVDEDGYTWHYVEFQDALVGSGRSGWCADGDGDWLDGGKTHPLTFEIFDGVRATDDLTLYSSASTSATVNDYAQAGDVGTVHEGPEYNDDYEWWYVDVHEGEGEGWAVADRLGEHPLGCGDAAWANDDNQYALAKILRTEASSSVVGHEARVAVGYTVLNRMDRNDTDSVYDVWDAFAHWDDPLQEDLDLAWDVLTCAEFDNSGGSTHFYSPKSMPAEGEDTSCCDTDGGLEWVPGLSERHYRPSWSVDFYQTWVPGVQMKNFKFYRALGWDPVN